MKTQTGLTIKLINNKITVVSEHLKEHPTHNVELGVKIQSGFTPITRLGINEWFNTFQIQ